jgi:[acyl-carrier-protein] S-malonyltransferase
MMNKTAWLFPGQGSQYVGMGSILCERYDEARLTFEQAEQTLGIALRRTMRDGPEETLKQTEYAQPAIFVASVAFARVLCSLGMSPDMVAGHSLGEYSALVIGGALDFEEGLRLVKERALSMQEACTLNPGTMLAVLGLETPVVEEICSGVSGGVVDVANINSPGQVVISGEHAAVQTAGEAARERGAKRTIPLPVSGAFHSRLMRPAAERFGPAISAAAISLPGVGFFPNVSASLARDAEEVRDGLIRQLCSPVRWLETIEGMIGEGARTFVEVGPGKVLTGLLKRIDGSAVGHSVDGADSIEAIAGKC